MRSSLRVAGLAVALLAGGCNAQVVQEHYYPSSAWGTGHSGEDLRVRVAGTASDCALGQLSRSGAITEAVGGIVDQRVDRELVEREIVASARAAAAESVGRNLELAMSGLQARGASAASDAELLRMLNIVGAGLGATRPFATVGEAQAFLDRVPAR